MSLLELLIAAKNVNRHVNKYVSMLEIKYICKGNNGKLLITFSAKWLQPTKKGRTTTLLLCQLLSCSSQLKKEDDTDTDEKESIKRNLN